MTKRASCSCSSHGTFLTAKGLEEAAQRFSLEGLAPRGEVDYLDKVASVSALDEDEGCPDAWDDRLLDQQYRRFLNGS